MKDYSCMYHFRAKQNPIYDIYMYIQVILVHLLTRTLICLLSYILEKVISIFY